MNIQAGITASKEHMVSKDDTALAHGSGTVEVLATPALIALMENTADRSVQASLPQGHITVGTEIHIRHIKATLIGGLLKISSRLTQVEGKKLQFELEAHDENGKIGFGTHTRYVVEEESFLGGAV